MPDISLIGYHDEGMRAFKEGKEMWECPYVTPTSPVCALAPWLAGWMMAKQIAANASLVIDSAL